jgi:uncharacterized protein YidB (DUF937 family)
LSEKEGVVDDLGEMLGGITGQASSGGGIADVFGSLVGGEGGLQNLVGQLANSGLADQVGSWVGVGPNQDVDPNQLRGALGEAQVSALAEKSGMSVEQLLPLLAAALPAVIDALTPDGNVTSGDATSGFDIGGLLEGLGKAAQAGPTSPLAQLGNMFGNKG